ncbi:MAG: hypothetical protein DHS20C18_47710 [Saprospiraceae bacterium]|nr:MAG: hypothetical protein DHS20C18_47710 [Saprospiraceae bacterium]
MGSCFAEHIGGRLLRYKFPTLLNSHGILFNAISIAQALQDLLSEKQYVEADLFQHGEQWHSYAHHGHFSHPDLAEALAQINGRLNEARNFLEKTDILVLTLGTANAFSLRTSGAIVANCHKVPGTAFDRVRLLVSDIVKTLGDAIQALQNRRPELKVLLTVSPVRHIRDGLVENQRSKATLLLAAEALQQSFDFVYYFPSYEMVMDDLRDYRFYDQDMIHPSPMAIDYIWEQFRMAFFSEETQQLLQRIDRILSASRHRPFQPESAAHQTFQKKQLSEIAALQTKWPTLDFNKEITIFSNK